MEISRNGTRHSNKGPAEFFTGKVRVDPLFSAHDPARGSASYVTFEPGAPPGTPIRSTSPSS